MKTNVLAAALTLGFSVTAVNALVGAWGQCGGVTYTGETACVSGYGCKYLNDLKPNILLSIYAYIVLLAMRTVGPVGQHYHQDNRSHKHHPRHHDSDDHIQSDNNYIVPYNDSNDYHFVQDDDNFLENHHYFEQDFVPPAALHPTIGDSSTQTGFDPNGIQPSVGNPMGNPPYPGWTSSGGINWIDVATAKYNRSTVLTYNLAYGGATIDANLVAPYASNVLSLTDQTNQFLSIYANSPASAPWSPSNTLFSVFIGINDISNAWWRSDWLTFVDTLITAQFALVEKMYNAGGRKFLIFNIPPIERAPVNLSQSQANRDALKTALALWSSKLQTYITNFKSSHSGTTFWFYDSNADFNYVLDNPSSFGMNTDVTLYGNNPTYAWFNDFHPGIIIQDYLGKRVDDLLTGFW
ncbi:Acetylesterase [Drechslerella dactyloides]|uniref:Acetylesterase n=1 Tax=Drechslerella dactyloides TaxID=74499 RepID=A0AAD6NNB7_DREDA|nr:Acetylesterase [Drechslerella dactyloides]